MRRLTWAFGVLLAVTVSGCTAPTDQGIPTTVGRAPIDHPSQERILADGTVTHAEMEEALLAVVDCIERNGFDAELKTFVPRLRYEIEFADKGNETLASRDAVYDGCEATYLGWVQDAYFDEHGLSPEEIEARNHQITACIESRSGLDLAGMTFGQVVEVANTAHLLVCDEGIPPPPR